MRLFLLLLFLLLQYSCTLTDNFSEEPMFLQIDSVDLITSSNDVYPSHKIQDVSVFVGGENIGVFEIPAKVPVLGEGEVEVTIFAGIRNNGLVLSPKQYPYYERFVRTFDFEANKVITVNPEFTYLSGSKFAFNENFEADLLFDIDLDGDDSSAFVKSEETPFGSFCGRMTVTQENAAYQVATAEVFQTDVFQGAEVYLELDYKCELPFIVGFIGYDGSIRTQEGFIALFESEDWDKVYLDLSTILNGGEFDSYQIFIAGQPWTPEDDCREDGCWDTNGNGEADPEEDTNGDGITDERDCEDCKANIYIDNVRLVYI